MNKKITITQMSEVDLRDAFYDTLVKMGVEGGDTIPRDVMSFKETLIQILFYTIEEKKDT